MTYTEIFYKVLKIGSHSTTSADYIMQKAVEVTDYCLTQYIEVEPNKYYWYVEFSKDGGVFDQDLHTAVVEAFIRYYKKEAYIRCIQT